MDHVRWRKERGRGALTLALLLIRILSSSARAGASGLMMPGGAAVNRVAGAISATGDAIEQWMEGRASFADQLRIATRRRRVPRVRDISDPVQLGVHPAAELARTGGAGDRLPRFIPRDAMEDLRVHLADGSTFVVLVGESTAGKTRAAYEAMRALLPAHKLIYPNGRKALVRLVPEICLNRRVVVWLDDLDLYLGLDGLNAAMVQQMTAEPGNRIVLLATMSAAAAARFGARAAADQELGDDLVRSGRDVLRLARVVRLERAWSPAELERAHEQSTDPRIAAAIRNARAERRGVAEYLAAAPQLLDDWLNAWEGGRPRGAALVAAGVDARRAGYHHALPVELLREMHEAYLELHSGASLHPEPWDEALAWATTALHGTSSLLLPRDDGHYLAFDYLHDAIDAKQPPQRIPEHTWQTLIEYVDAASALDIGSAALARGDLWHASNALEKAVKAGELRARRPHATCVCDAGDPVRAAKMFVDLMQETTRTDGHDGAETLMNRQGYARCIGEAGHPADAARQLHGIAADSERVLGPQHPTTLGSRTLLTLFKGQTGDLRSAAQQHQALVSELSVALGSDDPLTLNNRFWHAYFVGEAGRPGQAARLLDGLVADRTRLQGPYAWLTLNNRRHHVHFIGESGKAGKAASMFLTLIEDCRTVLGDTHPDTLACRHGLARFLGDAGNPQAAVLLLEELLQDESNMRMYGPDNTITLRHRRYHAHFIGESDPRAAVKLLRVLQSDTRRILGSRHPAHIAASCELARYTGMSGRYEQAARMYAELAARCVRILGMDNPQTLCARNGHARFTGDAGDFAQAAELFEIIVIDRARVLGATHPYTLNSRNGHANFVGRAGDPARAIRLLQAILVDRTRLFGTDHPWTKRTQVELAELQAG
jgi:eukaryotic-like serine/threonine-protein kinase